MSDYSWIITSDLINDGAETGVSCGPASYEEVNAKGKAFRLLDDDGEIYYEGKLIETDNTDGFEPLDDFGMPNAGCTEIQYRDEFGNWRSL